MKDAYTPPDDRQLSGSDNLKNEQKKISKHLILTGSIKDKVPLPLSDGKTTVYPRPDSDRDVVRLRYEYAITFHPLKAKIAE